LITQNTLNLDFQPILKEETFFTDECNQEAYKYVHANMDLWPNRGLIIYGPSGSGKTHLANLWCDVLDEPVAYINCTNFEYSHNMNRELFIDELSIKRNLIIDRVEFIATNKNESLQNFEWDMVNGNKKQISNAKWQQFVCHIYNLAYQLHGKILILSRLPLEKLEIQTPDLQSRFNSLMPVEIKSPSDYLIKGVINKLFADLSVSVPKEVVTSIFYKVDRSFVAIRNMVFAINSYALEQKRQISVCLVRDYFESSSELEG
jgi:chromosomal replication initiation ATPase DnaA